MVKLKTILTLIESHIRIMIRGFDCTSTSDYSDEDYFTEDPDIERDPKEYLIYEGLDGDLPLRKYEECQDCRVMRIYPRHERAKEKEDSSNDSVDLLEIWIDVG